MKRLIGQLCAALLAFAPVAALAAAPTTDGTVSSTWSGGTSGSASLTTTQTNDVVVVMVSFEGLSGTPTTVSSVTATGLTFTRRGGACAAQNSFFQCLDVWWAPASAIQSAKSITVTTAGGIDDAVIGIFAAHGVNNISAPWDTNGAVPVFTTNNTGGSWPASPTFSTSQANDLLIAAGASGSSTTVDTSSWTSLVGATNGGGTLSASLQSFSNAVSATQTGATVPFTLASGTINVRYADALTADASGGGGSTGTHLALTGAGK